MLPLVILLVWLAGPLPDAAAQTSEEQRCYNAVQGRVAWAKNGSTQWAQANLQRLCEGTRNHQKTIGCFRTAIQSGQYQWGEAIGLCRHITGIEETYFDYQCQREPYTRSLQALPASQRFNGDSLKCSAGADRDKNRFRDACKKHDVCYSAPWEMAGWTGAESAAARAVCDGQFLVDMQQICTERASGQGIRCRVAADAFHKAVTAGAISNWMRGQDHARTNGCQVTRVKRGGIVNSNPAPRPRQKWAVEIDCYHKDLDHEDTSDRVAVTFYAGNTVVGTKAKNGVTCRSMGADPTWSLQTDQLVTRVVVATNGANAFYIDELRVSRDNTQIVHHGRDNGSGWCLSTDSNDTNAGWRNNMSSAGCRNAHVFSAP